MRAEKRRRQAPRAANGRTPVPETGNCSRDRVFSVPAWNYNHEGEERRMKIEVGGLFGLLILIADIWAIVNVLGSRSSTGAKVLWTVLILILPLVGFIIWLVAGPRAPKTA
jgi:hypothetical protein